MKTYKFRVKNIGIIKITAYSYGEALKILSGLYTEIKYD